MKKLELLAPAKNMEQGIAAINHGADAVYIGAPAFGARAAAGNTLQEIEQLVRHAHCYGARVFATVNTLLFDNEMADAVRLLHELYSIGVDAAIIQDLGLLECDIPPIELHASTQTHNATVERVKFMEQVGFKRVILARETSLAEMQAIREDTSVELEAFVQGALCVSYSGQCYMSQYLNQRSGNRGCCGQPCRSAYDLYNAQGTLLRRGEHLLSLKDFSAAQHIQSMVDAGITSFKIEGRLKDMSYVKNVTAYYRQLLDNLLAERPDCQPSSSGRCRFFFTPDLEKTFNRGFTDYFLTQRKPMATMSTQKSIGKKMGQVSKIDRSSITIKSREPFTAGDGLCFFNANGELEGFFVNHVQGNTIQPNRMPASLTVGTPIWRNNDFAFEKQLQGRSAERKIAVDILLSESDHGGFQLEMKDDDGCSGLGHVDNCEKTAANHPAKAEEQIQKQLGKLGDTPFVARSVQNKCSHTYFIPASVLNELRRQAAENLESSRCSAFFPGDSKHSPDAPAAERWHFEKTDAPYFTNTLDYRANIINQQSEQFYRRHGISELEHGLEQTEDYAGKALMTTRYCLRYELGCCKKLSPQQWHLERPHLYEGALYLRNNRNWFQLEFDCKNCQMRVLLAEKSPLEGKDKQK